MKSLDQDSSFFREEAQTNVSMHANEQALFIIIAALECFPDYPYDNSWPEQEKEEVTFSQWTLNELLDLICDHPWTLATDTIEDFIVRCRIYELNSIFSDQKRIFSIAEKTASEILTEIKENETCCAS